MANTYNTNEMAELRTLILDQAKLVTELPLTPEDNSFSNPLADAVDFVNRRISWLQENDQKTKAWENMAEILGEIVTYERGTWATAKSKLGAIINGFNQLRLDNRALKETATSREEVEVLQGQVAQQAEEIENLRSQLADALDQVEAAKSETRYRYEVPRPASRLLDGTGVEVGDDILLTTGLPNDVETRIEWVLDKDEGMVGIAVYVDHSQQPWIFPIHLFISAWEHAHNTVFDNTNHEHTHGLYFAVLTIAVRLADVMVEQFGPIMGLIYSAHQHTTERGRLLGDELENVPVRGSNLDAAGSEHEPEEDFEAVPAARNHATGTAEGDGDDDLPAIDDLDEAPAGSLEQFERADDGDEVG